VKSGAVSFGDMQFHQPHLKLKSKTIERRPKSSKGFLVRPNHVRELADLNHHLCFDPWLYKEFSWRI